MNKELASKLISDNLTSIYGYAFGKLYDKSHAEDLAAEIVCEVLRSVERLEKEEAFWGFVWRIAENTFRKFIRKEQYQQTCELTTDLSDTSDLYYNGHVPSPEEHYVAQEEQSEELFLLRRELSLLSKLNREICVAYYIDNKSCSQIAVEQNTTLETVKYHLFKTRKLLKEGIGMTRTLGEKSYNPGVFRLNFWGDHNKYDALFNRKLPGSILLAAYDTPVSMEELSMELGVAVPYLEDEIELLESAGVIKKQGTKYHTNLVILTNEYEKRFEKETSGTYLVIATELFEQVVALLPKIRMLDFTWNQKDDNLLLFSIINTLMVQVYQNAKAWSPLGIPPKLPLGGNGWIWGFDNAYENNHFLGVTIETWNKEGTAWFSAENYRILERCQLYPHRHFFDKAEIMCDGILERATKQQNSLVTELIHGSFISCDDGVLSANFPVYTQESYTALCALLRPLADKITTFMMEITNHAYKLLSEYVPSSVKDQCLDIAKIHHSLEVAAILMETLIEEKKLIIPNAQVPLCVWGVKVK